MDGATILIMAISRAAACKEKAKSEGEGETA
jgi:hypothetical protein